MKLVPIIVLLLSVCFLVNYASATPITIINAGFEDPTLNEGDWTWFEDPPVPGWTTYNFNVNGPGIWNPTSSDYASEAPEGSNVAFIDASNGSLPSTGFGGISQVLTTTFNTNTIYTLDVEVGNTNWYLNDVYQVGYNNFPGYRVELYAGDTLLARDDSTLTPEEGIFLSSSISFAALSGYDNLIGQALEIRLLNDFSGEGWEVDFDNVRLDAAPVPEPVTMMLFGLGLLGLAGVSRKKQ